jgi:hypothetical protein
MQEIRCPSCNFLMGFSETAISTSGLLCHYCIIERTYTTATLEQSKRETDIDPIKNYAGWRADPAVLGGAFYEAQSRQTALDEFISFVPKLYNICDKKDKENE